MRVLRNLGLLLSATCLLISAAFRIEDYPLTANWAAVMDTISADSMRGHLSFLASDLLEGRNTPSPGLDIAAEYIAAQFRRAGLEEVGEHGYFQIAKAGPKGKEVPVRNVAAILRGSDPALNRTYVVLSAHYDHIGVNGGRVFNGANDDGSGVVSVIEIASAMARSGLRPRRSILFVTFFGEEEGMLGSKYFVAHPLVRIADIVAQLNLEQVGRTDDTAGPQFRRAGVTGFDYSDVGRVLQVAGKRTGVDVHGDNREPDDYFERSDNLPLADEGIPAHTIGVAFEFPDYHQPGDKWQKVDYENMAAVDRMVGTAVVMLANSSQRPRWNPSNKFAHHSAE